MLLLLLLSLAPVAQGWVIVPVKRVSVLRSSPIQSPPKDHDNERPDYWKPRDVDESILGEGTNRPGAIIETEEQLETKERIMEEIDAGERKVPRFFKEYGELIQDEEAEWDTDDPEAIDMATLGTWTIQDLRSKYPYEFDPTDPNEVDPNAHEMARTDVRYLKETEKDDDGVEVGYNPIFGPSNPFDERTLVGTTDSYMIDPKTRDDTLLQPLFPDPDDLENDLNENVATFRKSLDIIESYIDPFLEAPVPQNVAKWHGYPERTNFEPKNSTNNLFTDNPTDFDSMTPYDARTKAVEMANSKNAEWLPSHVSDDWHAGQRAPYESYGTLVGTLRSAPLNDEAVSRIQPVLNILGDCAVLLSIDEENSIYRFHYYGLMKNKFGMERWAETLMEDCGVSVGNVIFETGFRKRDHAYDGGDKYCNGPRPF